MTTIIPRPDVAVIVLTRNAGRLWPEWLKAIQRQTIQAGQYVVVDSMSTDQTAALAQAAGLDVHFVDPRHFNHGGTRQWAATLCPDAQWLVYLTQDAILKQPDSLERLLRHAEADPQVAMVYGRHVPRADADPLECHVRQFQYPAQSAVHDRRSFQRMGYRAAFASDVYAVYRASALRSVGGFPQRIIVSEDSYVAARLLLAGWKTVYAADATVEHSHRYNLWQTFRRYFDVGVFHAAEQPLMQMVGKPDGEAGKYVRSLIAYLAKRQPWLLPWAAVQTLVKLLGFRLGQRYQHLPPAFCRWLSVQKAYWQTLPFPHAVPPYLAPVGTALVRQQGAYLPRGRLLHQQCEKMTKNLLQNVDNEKMEY